MFTNTHGPRYVDGSGVTRDRMFFSLTDPKTQDGGEGGVAWIDTANIEANAFDDTEVQYVVPNSFAPATRSCSVEHSCVVSVRTL